MWGYIWSELLKAILTEPEPDVKVLLMESCARVGPSEEITYQYGYY